MTDSYGNTWYNNYYNGLNNSNGEDITPSQYNDPAWWQNAENWYTEDDASAWDFENVWEWNDTTQLPKLRNVGGQ